MGIGLTRPEHRALFVLIGLVLAGAAWQGLKHRGAGDVVVQGEGRWEKLADFEAGRTPPEPKDRSTPTPTAAPSLSGDSNQGGLDINAATAEEMDRLLPGIGPVKAGAIVQTRELLGRFSSIEQLDEVHGIGPATIEKIRPYIRPIDTSPPPAD